MANDHVTLVNDSVVIIPGNAVLMTTVQLPKMSHTELRRAVPFALEEHLAQNIEDCFFALGETDSAGNTIVAVIDKQRFESYLAAIHEKGWQPEMGFCGAVHIFRRQPG